MKFVFKSTTDFLTNSNDQTIFPNNLNTEMINKVLKMASALNKI